MSSSHYRSSVATPYRSAQKKKLSNGDESLVNDGPLSDFVLLIDESKPDQWQRRTQALAELVDSIPFDEVHDSKEWYGSPKTLRHLTRPLTALLKDPRSSVVKNVCESLIELFEKVRGYGRFLLKELVPVILDVHGQTVNTIRVSVEEMAVHVLPLVPCRAGMPAMLERLKNSKSRTVRQACAFYLGICIKSWTQPDYLTREVLMQVGTTLIKALRDASPQVRQEAKRGLEIMQHQYPTEYGALVNNPNGLIARDARLRKLLQKPADEIMDDVSISSRSAASTSRLYAARSSPTSYSARGSPFGRSSPSHINRGFQRNAVGHHQYRQAQSTRREAAAAAAHLPTTVVVAAGNKPSLTSTRRNNLGPPLRVSTKFGPESPVMASASSTSPVFEMNSPSKDSPAAVLHFDGADDPGPFVAGVEELKRQAKTRRSRRSSFLQEKWRMSSSNLVSEESTETNDKANENGHGETNGEAELPAELLETISPATTIESPTKLQQDIISPQTQEADIPEHAMIAKQVLEAHQTHVDSVMETLRLEMDAMRDFEKLLDEKEPSEEEVVTYFDCIGLCLDQRTASGRLLQREMNRISGIQEHSIGEI